MYAFFSNLWESALTLFNKIEFMDVLDVAIVAYIIYKAIKLIKETRAVQLLKGILILILSFFIAGQLGLKTMSFLLSHILQIGLFALIVVFQPELRRALEQVGRSKIGTLSVFNQSSEDAEENEKRIAKSIKDITAAAASLSRSRTGALIVLERKTKLGEIVKSGTIINSDTSSELICNIFYPNTPLHDGAMVIRNGKIYAAGCFLPLSDNYEISKQLGTRHRAALGMSENSDAVIVVVSEETGTISVAINGKLNRNFDAQALKTKLETELLSEKTSDANERKPGFWKVKL